MPTIKVEIEIEVSEELNTLALTQHIGNFKNDKGKQIGDFGFMIGSGDYRGSIKDGKKTAFFRVKAVQKITEALTDFLNIK